MNLKKLIDGIRLKSPGRALVLKERIGKTDRGVLQVAFMVAALDGEVTEAEYAAFDALAKKCRGYSPEQAAIALEAAMRSAGYLMLLSKRVTKAALVKAFVREARAALPEGFAYLSIEDIRRAVITWIAMGMSDGDYSVREKMCIEALRRLFAEMKITRAEQEEERWMALSPAFRQAYGIGANRANVELVTKDFVGRVEELVAKYGDSAEAEQELRRLISA